MLTDHLIYKAGVETQTERTNIWIPTAKGVRWMNWEAGTDMHILLILYIVRC